MWEGWQGEKRWERKKRREIEKRGREKTWSFSGRLEKHLVGRKTFKLCPSTMAFTSKFKIACWWWLKTCNSFCKSYFHYYGLLRLTLITFWGFISLWQNYSIYISKMFYFQKGIYSLLFFNTWQVASCQLTFFP